MLYDEAIERLKLDVADRMRGLGFAATTIALAAIEVSLAEHSDVSSTMVRRRDLEEMHNRIQALVSALAERDVEVAELRKKLGLDTTNEKPAPTQQVRARKQPKGHLGGGD